MTSVTFTDKGIHYNPNSFFQFDYGQKLEIKGLDFENNTVLEVHFARKGVTTNTKETTVLDGSVMVDVPDGLLLYDGEFNVYIYLIGDTSGKTYYSFTFYNKKRERPENYNTDESMVLSSVFVEDNTPSNDIEARLSAAEDAISKLILSGLGEI